MNKSNTPTEYRQELRSKILNTASEQFRTKGIKAVKMDDIAGTLSISKRTMYEIYENKEQLLMETVKEDHQKFEDQMQAYLAGGKRNVIDTILAFYRLKMNALSKVTPLYYTELQRYPEVIQWMEQKHLQHEHEEQSFFQQGIEEGYFRPDADYELLCNVSTGIMTYIMGNQLYKQYDLKEIFRNVSMLFLRGLCTQKGICEFDSQMEKMDK